MSELFGSEGSEPDEGEIVKQEYLVGSVGQEYVQNILSSTADPNSAIHDIQIKAGLSAPQCKPLLGLLDQLGCSRAESHKAVLEGARNMLLARIPGLSTDKLQALLEASFAYLGIPELRQIPLTVLEKLQPVPASFLKQLSEDIDLFQQLPDVVQRQVWELDKSLLQKHVLPLVNSFAFESDTVHSLLDIDAMLPPLPKMKPREEGRSRELRKTVRDSSPVLRKLSSMVANSRQVYKGIVELITVKYQDGDTGHMGLKDAALCALRSQLLMSLHDKAFTDLTNSEGCHRLVWTLDACLKDKVLDARRLQEMRSFFEQYDGRRDSRGGQLRQQHSIPDNDAESAGIPGVGHSQNDQPGRVIGDAAMALRDPPVMFLLAHAVMRQLDHCIAHCRLPCDSPELTLLTRMMALGIASRDIVRERDYYIPTPNPDLLHSVYPLLANVILEGQLRAANKTPARAPGDLKDSLVDFISQDHIAQLVSGVFILEKLAAGDVSTATNIMHPFTQAMQQHKNLTNFVPFSFTLARRVEVLVRDNILDLDKQEHRDLWHMIVQQVLLRCVDADLQVHIGLLKVLLQALDFQHQRAQRNAEARGREAHTDDVLPVNQLNEILETALHNSRKSRRRMQKRKREGLEAYGSMASITSAAASFGVGDTESEYLARGTDTLKRLYAAFVDKLPELGHESSAPALHNYLQEGQKHDANFG